MSCGVRVKLDLSDFVLDAGARRWILLIPGKMVTVGDLLDKIRGEYGQVKEGDTLTVFLEEQFMVPPWEPLAILKEGDLLRVTLSQGDRSIPGPPDAKRQKMETRTDDKKKANRENPAKRVDLKKNPIDVDKDGQREKKSGKTAAAPESSSSSDSSSEEEESTGVNVATEKKSEVVKESSSSDSDSESESEEEEEGKLKKTVSTAQLHSTPSLAKQPPKAKSCSSSSDDSSSDEEESSGMKAVGIKKATGAKTSLKTGTEAAQAAAKSSSSSSSSEEEEEKDVSKSKPLKWQPVAKGTCSENGESEQGKKKRKRKRKPKNKNKLSPDQMPDYGPPIQPNPAIASRAEVQRTNGHHRFEEEENNMEVEEAEEESMSAEAMRALYNKSVSVTTPLPPPAPVATPCQSSKSTAGGSSVSCEEALLASQDQRVVSNQSVATKAYQPKPPPRVVFRPRALDVGQLKQQQQASNGAGSRFQLSSSTTAPNGMEALLSCQGQVFAKDGSERVLNGKTGSTLEKDYSSFPPLDAVPGVGALVAYKVMELSVDYTPGVSAYKEGKVVGVEGEKLFIELLAGFVKRTGGRFELGEEESVEKNVEHTMRELIEPVLVKPA